jgi:hypothetical protein
MARIRWVRTWMAAALALALGTASGAAAEESKVPPPGPEHARLGFFVGKWKGAGVMNENPFMPGGKFTSSETCEWFPGRYAVVCRATGTGPMGPTQSLGIMTYSPEEKVYLYWGVDNTPMAMATVPRGAVDGDVWTYLDESRMGGQTVKSRYVLKVLGADAYGFRWEILGPDGQWKTISEGKSTRVKAK